MHQTPFALLSEITTSQVHSMDSETHGMAELRNNLVQSSSVTEAPGLFKEEVKEYRK